MKLIGYDIDDDGFLIPKVKIKEGELPNPFVLIFDPEYDQEDA